ncbi:MAG: hypothetical protein WCA12_21305 [Burkholderiales bacterium]
MSASSTSHSLILAADGLDEILAGLPGFDVAIDPLATEPIDEAIVDATGAAGRVVPAVTNEDDGHRLSLAHLRLSRV